MGDPAGWARDLLAAFGDTELVPDATRVCAVVAVLQQESGFQADPPVANLGTLVRVRLREEAERFGPLGLPAMERLLKDRAPGDRRSFEERIRRLRTERELDLLFRDMLEAERREHPAMVATANLLDSLFRGRRLEDLNPVTTAGSMQVSVRWAIDYARSRGWPDAEETVRDALYTRAGGLRFGVPRLWGYPLSDGDVVYRFADYNAGQYAARNAAVQRALGQLTSVRLAPDGDLLVYGPDGRPTDEESETLRAFRLFRERFVPSFPEARLRGDLERGKEQAFEETPSYLALRRVYRERIGSALPTASMPELELKSPKLRRGYTTAPTPETCSATTGRASSGCEESDPGDTRRARGVHSPVRQTSSAPVTTWAPREARAHGRRDGRLVQAWLRARRRRRRALLPRVRCARAGPPSAHARRPLARRAPAGEARLWVEPLVAASREGEDEQPVLPDLVRAAPDFAVLRGRRVDPPDLTHLRDAEAVLAALLDAGAAAVLDVEARRWWTPGAFRREVLAGFRPAVRAHVSVRARRGLVETRGLRKFGRPDLRFHRVPPAEEPEALEVCWTLVEQLARGARPGPRFSAGRLRLQPCGEPDHPALEAEWPQPPLPRIRSA